MLKSAADAPHLPPPATTGTAKSGSGITSGASLSSAAAASVQSTRGGTGMGIFRTYEAYAGYSMTLLVARQVCMMTMSHRADPSRTGHLVAELLKS